MDLLKYFEENEFWNDSLAVSLLISLLALIAILISLGTLYQSITKTKHPDWYVAEKFVQKEDKPSVVIQALTDIVPIEREEEIIMDHEYDGIRELDNNLPPWWKYGFYLCIVWAVIYFTHYHVLELGALSAEEYKQEMLEADLALKERKAKGGLTIDAHNVSYQNDPVSLARGESLFQANCRTCHGVNAQGDIGPNLTDAYWVYGGDIGSRFNLVLHGKGTMPKWEGRLSGKDIQNILSYLKSIEGSNPPNAKEAEGELFIEIDVQNVDAE